MNKKKRGFSLLEVLVALVVISIGMAAALSLSVKNIDTLTEIETRTYASWVAQNLIAEFKLQKTTPVGIIEGEDKLGGHTWYWKADIKPTADQDVLQLHMLVSVSDTFNQVAADITAYLSTTPS